MLNDLREQRLDEIIGSYLDGLHAGRSPDREKILEANPDLADDLRAFFADNDRLDGITAPLRKAVLGETPTFPGEAVGEHEIIAEIARGGMGIVYKARHKTLNRMVALKVLRAGPLATPAERQRFRTEAEAAAHLDHPNLVPVYEVGEHEGLPFFAMKLVEGGSLADHISRYANDPKAAAELIAIAADAVHFAHQHGFLHRDLKPANILIGPNGEPFVSDFGLAKRFGGQNTPSDGAELTRTGAVVGTPSYMAPEQASGQKGAVSTAADVYGLGAILYELLTGRPPFRESTLVETLRKVVEDEPVRPSAIKEGIDRDLETICLKCLEKEPARRYGSARELAEDLRRFRAGLPIEARPVGTGEFIWRWCRRRPAIAGLLATLGATIVIAFGLVVWQLQRVEANARTARENGRIAESHARTAEANARKAEASAEQARINAKRADKERDHAKAETERAEVNFRQTRDLVGNLCNQFCERDLLDVPGIQPVRKRMLQEALRHYKKLTAQRPNDPDIRRELGETFTRMGAAESSTGDKAESLKAYEQALAIFKQLHRERPDDPALWNKVAGAHISVGTVQSDLGQERACRASYEEACKLYEQFLQKKPKDRDLRDGLATVLHNLAMVDRRAGRLTEAMASLERSRSMQEELLKQEPRNPYVRVGLAVTLNTIGTQQADLAGFEDAALASYQAAQKIREKLVADFPRAARYRRDLAESHHNIGNALRRAGKIDEALESYAQEQQILNKLIEDNPAVPLFRRDLAGAHSNFGVAYARAGKKAESLAAFRKAAAMQEKLVKENQAVRGYQDDLAQTYFNIGVTQNSMGQPAEAILSYQQSRDLLLNLVKSQPDDLDQQHRLGGTLNNLGILQGQRRKIDEAIATLQQAVRHQRIAFDRAPQIAKYREALGLSYASLGEAQRVANRFSEAVESFQQWQKLWPDNPAQLYLSAKELAKVAYWTGKQRAEPTDAERAQQTEYYALTLKALHQSVAKGFRDAKQLEKEPAFRPLHDQAEFQALLKNLRK